MVSKLDVDGRGENVAVSQMRLIFLCCGHVIVLLLKSDAGLHEFSPGVCSAHTPAST